MSLTVLVRARAFVREVLQPRKYEARRANGTAGGVEPTFREWQLFGKGTHCDPLQGGYPRCRRLAGETGNHLRSIIETAPTHRRQMRALGVTEA